MTNNNMIFVANWKMHGNFNDISKVKTVLNLIKNKKYKKIKIIYCPPFTLLKSFSNYFNNTKLNIGAQNCYYKSDYGPYTGNVNAKLIKSAGAKYIILGHSENRNEGETDLLINHKIKSVLKEKLSVIFCVGETIHEKKKKITFQVLKRQISKGLKGIKNTNKIIIAYEPVWSIGSGIIPSRNELEKNIKNINKILKQLKFKNSIKILYGGSVNSKNANEISKIDGIGGLLVGGASLNSKKFVDIIKKTSN